MWTQWQTQRSSPLFKWHLRSTLRYMLLKALSSYPRAWRRWKGSSSETTLTVIMPVPASPHQHFLSTCIYQMQLWHQPKLWVCLSHLHVTLRRKKKGKEKSNENYNICNSPFNREAFSKTSVKRKLQRKLKTFAWQKTTAKPSSFRNLNLLALFLSPLLMVSILNNASFSLQINYFNTTEKYCTSIITEKLSAQNQLATLIHAYSICRLACMPCNQRHNDTL